MSMATAQTHKPSPFQFCHIGRSAVSSSPSSSFPSFFLIYATSLYYRNFRNKCYGIQTAMMKNAWPLIDDVSRHENDSTRKIRVQNVLNAYL